MKKKNIDKLLDSLKSIAEYPLATYDIQGRGKMVEIIYANALRNFAKEALAEWNENESPGKG